MATVVRYVNPGSSGGDGTTSALSGANAAYASLSAWEAAENTNLDTANNIMQVNCVGSTADTTAVTISGWTTSATDYIEIIGDWAPLTDGKFSTSKYRLNVQNFTQLTIANATAFIRIHNLQIYNSDVNTGNIWGILCNSTITSGEIRIYNNCIRGNNNTSWYDMGIRILGGTATYYIYQNWIYDWGTTADFNYSAIYFNPNTIAGGVNCYCENNTFHNNVVGIQRFAGNLIAINNIVKGSGNTYSYVGTFATGTDYNSTDSTDSIGVGSNNKTSQTFTFVDEANDDFHLASTDTGAKDSGTSSVNGGFTTDIDGQTRSGTWDIGAHEYQAVGGGLSIPVAMNQYRQRWA